MDSFLQRNLKNWAAQAQPPEASRARLLKKAGRLPAHARRVGHTPADSRWRSVLAHHLQASLIWYSERGTRYHRLQVAWDRLRAPNLIHAEGMPGSWWSPSHPTSVELITKTMVYLHQGNVRCVSSAV